MKKINSKITKCEKEILEVLWEEEFPMTATEITNISKNRTWKDNSVHLLLSSLLKKGFIEVAGMKKTTKNYARTFKAALTREEYFISQIRQEEANTSCTLSRLFHAFLEEEEDVELLDNLSKLIDERKKKLLNI